MKINTTPIQGLLIIEPKIFRDDRGYFFEAFRKDLFTAQAGAVEFVQDNISRSVKNTIRGLHYQVGACAQGKLCQVLRGAVLDVAVDIRFGSPTFGKYFSVELSDENHIQLWIPPGFAHGFSVLSDDVLFSYKCTAYYSKEHERSILFNDAALQIDWRVSEPIVSPKDLQGKEFNSIDRDFVFAGA